MTYGYVYVAQVAMGAYKTSSRSSQEARYRTFPRHRLRALHQPHPVGGQTRTDEEGREAGYCFLV